MITLGCIADDFTGGTDVAAAVRRSGMSVSLLFDIPQNTNEVPATDAVVIALKTRTIPAADAVAQSLAALSWLQEHDVDRVYFKYCSTFDSTEKGNIGPVADALLDALAESMTLVCPASPEHGRTMYRGNLFVGDDLLSESSMRHHPLTPMTDSRIPRVMQAQTVGAVGLLPLHEVRSGAETVKVRLKELAAAKVRHVVVDAIDRSDLDVVAAGSRDLRLYTGGAGLAGALATALGTPGDLSSAVEQRLPTGPGVVLAGSCSAATLAQVATAAEVFPSYRLDPVATPDPGEMLTKASEWLRSQLGKWADLDLLLGRTRGPRTGPRSHGTSDLRPPRADAGCAGQGGRSARCRTSRGCGRGDLWSSRPVPRHRHRRHRQRGRPRCPMVPDRGRTTSRPSPEVGEPRSERSAGSIDVGNRTMNQAAPMVDTQQAQAIVDLGASLFARTLTFGRTGNLSVRSGDTILVTPTGVSLGALDPEQLSVIDLQGAHISGSKPSKEAFLHAAVYRARPTAGAVVHLHSTHAVAVSCLADVDPSNVLPPLTAYYAMRVGDLPLLPYHAPGDTSLEQLAETTARAHRCFLLANHGSVVAGTDLAAAADAAEELEETARLFLLLHGHRTRPLTLEQTDFLRERYPS